MHAPATRRYAKIAGKRSAGGNGRKMSRMKKMCVVLFFLWSFALMPGQGNAEELQVQADASILIDADSGKILYEKKANTPLGIAEITKMMTTYIVLEAIQQGKLQWEQEVSISDYTYTLAQNDEIRKVNLKQGSVYTVKALYEAMVVYNANDAAVALAEAVAGNETEFVRLMNEKAKELNLSGYKFVNASGLNNSFLLNMQPEGTGTMDENVMSARSVARLAYALYTSFPEVVNATSQVEIWFNEGTPESFQVTNWNRMLPSLEYSYSTVNGLFGGHSPFAGYSMVSFAERNGKKLIAVVMKAVNEQGEESEEALYAEMTKILDYGFENFDRVELISAGYKMKEQDMLTVIKGESRKVPVETVDAVSLMLKPKERELYVPVLLLDMDYVEAPVEKGTVVGKLLLERSEGKDLGFITGEAIMVDVVASENVNEAKQFKLFLQGISAFWRSLWHEANEFVGNE